MTFSRRLFAGVSVAAILSNSAAYALQQGTPNANGIGGLAIGNALSELATAGSQAAARANLGLGSLATLSTLSGLDASGTLALATGGTTPRTAAARAADRINVKDFGAKGDGTTDDGPAISLAIAQANAVFATFGTRPVIYLPAGRYRVATALTQFAQNVPGALKGDGRFKTFIQMDPSLSGDLFSWDEAWGLTPLVSGTYTAGSAWNGASVDDMTIAANTANGAVQNALVFYDRNDFVSMHNVDLMYFNGSCLSVGKTKIQPQAYMRESNFYGVRMWACGSATAPAVLLDSQNTSSTTGVDATNELSFYDTDIISSNGKSLVIQNTASGSGGNQGTRLIRFLGLRVESGTDDLITIGNPSSSGIVNTVQILGLEENAVAAGKCGIRTTSTAPSVPSNIRVQGSSIGGSGQGLCIAAGQDIKADIAIGTAQTNLTVGPSSAVTGPVYVDDNGNEKNWTTAIDPTSVSNVRLPSYNYGAPGGPTNVLANPHDGATSRGNPIPSGVVGVVDLQSQRFSATQIPQASYGTIGGGENNSIPPGATDATVSGGNQNSASYRASVCGGFGNNAAGQYSYACGFQALAQRFGIWAWASGQIVTKGDAQMEMAVLRGVGSTTSAIRLTSDGATAGAGNVFNVPSNMAFGLKILLTARDVTTPANSYTWSVPVATILCGSSNSTCSLSLGTPVTLATNSWAPTVSATADTTNGGLNLSFTPPAGNTDTIHVVARVESVEVQ